MTAQRRGGIIQFKMNGELQDAKGNFTYNLGRPKREAVVGSSGVQGFKETPQVPFIEGEITDRGTLDLATLVEMVDAEITLELANGKVFTLSGAYFAADGTANTEEGNIAVRFEGEFAEEVS